MGVETPAGFEGERSSLVLNSTRREVGVRCACLTSRHQPLHSRDPNGSRLTSPTCTTQFQTWNGGAHARWLRVCFRPSPGALALARSTRRRNGA